MKVFKKNEHSVLIKPFGTGGKLYLGVGILVYFDLTAPESPLTEQELWGDIPDKLPQGQALDQGMPKPKGEVLVTGSCCAPKDAAWQAGQVSFRLGPIAKTLNIFSDRYWSQSLSGMKIISRYNQFNQMPIVYENAFGGPDYDLNPLGKGIRQTAGPDGNPVVPLPNIENPKEMIGSPDDRPKPAGFGPLDMMWPQRAEKNGTYDDRWLRERWPFFPDDMNYEFFNTAPADQQMEGFFRGDEPLEIINMHPDYRALTSRLPGLRIRCFVSKKKDLKASVETEELFQEITTRIDTVWLFPGILRGVVVHRGTTEILDDEYADVTRLFISSENLVDQPKPIEYYWEAQKKALDNKVPIDLAPLAGIQGKINKAMQKIRLIPQKLDDAKKRAMGQAPSLGHTPEEALAAGPKIIGEQLQMLTELEAKMAALKLRLSPYSHLVKVEYGFIKDIKAKLVKASGKFEDAQKKVAKMRQQLADHQKGLREGLNQKFTLQQLKDLGLDQDVWAPEKKVNPWHDRGFPLVVSWRKNMEQNRDLAAPLLALGFQQRTLTRAWLGHNPESLTDDPSLWGLDSPKDEAGRIDPLQLPAGLVMPRFKGPVLERIAVRPGDPTDPGRDVLAPGSSDAPLALVYDDQAPAVRVADELEAHFLWQEAGDFFSIFALKDPGTAPQGDAAQTLKQAPAMLIVLPASHGKSLASQKPWQEKYPKAIIKPLPEGENLFQAHKKGLDLRSWLIEALPSSLSQGALTGAAIELPPEGEAPSKPPMGPLTLPPLDIKGMVEGFIKDMNAFMDKKMAPIKAFQKEAEDKAVQKILSVGGDPQDFLGAAKKPSPASMLEGSQAGVAKIEKERARLKAMGMLDPALDHQLTEAAAKIDAAGKQGQALMTEGQAKIKAAQKTGQELRGMKKTGQLPPNVKEKLAAAGVDPDKLKKLTREEVLARYARGESLAGTNLAGIDLSQADLQGVDLTEANCQKTIFTGSNLDRANLTRIMANKADFSGCSLKKALLDMAMLIEAKFKKANLGQADCKQTLLKKADLTGADLTGANLYMTILQQAILKETLFKNTRAELAIFSGADVSGAIFGGAKLQKCYFKGNILDRTDFSGSSINQTMLWEVKGKEVKFSGANMDKSRIGGQSSLPGADFTGASLRQACFRESDLNRSDFRGCHIEGALIEDCDLTRASFCRVSLKKSRLNKSDLTGADLKGANLFMGSLRKAVLINTDLSGSNLYGVDFYKARIGGQTKFDLANLKMSQLHQRTDLLK